MTEYLTLKRNVSESRNARYPKDRRIRCDIYITEYEDDSGIVYRKAFYTRPLVKPKIPTIGTHTELNNLKYQL